MNQVLYSLLEEHNLDQISVIEVMIGAKGSYNNPILHQFRISEMATKNCSLVILRCSE